MDRRAGRESAASSADLTGVPPGRVLEPTDLAEDVLAALQAVQRQPSVAPASVDGQDEARHVRSVAAPGVLMISRQGLPMTPESGSPQAFHANGLVTLIREGQ